MLYTLDFDIMKALDMKIKMAVKITNPIKSFPKLFHLLHAE
jgi:hypothetical protein